MSDTIVKVIEKISQPTIDNSEIYKEIINSQNQTYNLLIVVFLGIMAVFAGATWLYNKKIVKSEIIKETDKIFSLEKEKLINEFRKEFESELDFVKAESARLFALVVNGETPEELVNRFYWWLQCVKYYKLIDKGIGVRLGTEGALEAIKLILKKENKTNCKNWVEKTYSEKDLFFYDIIKTIPGELNDEKVELKKLTDEFLK